MTLWQICKLHKLIMLSRISIRNANLLSRTTDCWSGRIFQSTKAAEYGKVTDGLVKDLRGVVGKSNVTTAEAAREQHSHDESHHKAHMPDAVVFANTVEHVSKVAQMCSKNRIPLVTFGLGTGLEGGVNPVMGGVSLDVGKMKTVVKVNPEDFDCTVECGVTRRELNSFIRTMGLTFPVDPGAEASLGGMCATSASGTNAVRYGTMRENTLNLEVVGVDGNVFWTSGNGKRCVKTAAGYNLTNLFVGSEGTLGIITKAIIKLHAIPESTMAAVVHFHDVQEAVDTTVQVLQTGVPIARIEFLDEVAIRAFNTYSHFSMKETPSLFLEFHGSPSSVKEQVQTVEEIAGSNGGSNFKWASDIDERNRLWRARHDLLYAALALVPGSRAYSTDVCVPISNLPEAVVQTKEMIKKTNLIAPICGHVGDGNFHCVVLSADPSEQQVQQIKDFSSDVALLAMKLDGTCTGEHGIGMGKQTLLEKELGPEGMAMMKVVKQAFDPNNILNPGKIFL